METILRSENIVQLSDKNATVVVLNETDTPDLNIGFRDVELVAETVSQQLVINSPGFGGGQTNVIVGSGNGYFPGGWA